MTEIVVAAIGALAIVGAASVPALLTKRAVGKPNGQGNVVQMLETVIRTQGVHDEKLDRVEARMDKFDGRMKALEKAHGLEVNE